MILNDEGAEGANDFGESSSNAGRWTRESVRLSSARRVRKEMYQQLYHLRLIRG